MRRHDRGQWLSDLWRDTRHAARSLRRAPGYTAVVVLTLALGIGAASTAQSVIDPLLLRPLPFAQPERLVTLGSAADGEYGVSLLQGEYALIQEHVAGLERLSLVLPGQAWGLAKGGEAERVSGSLVTPDFFGTLGVHALRGHVDDELSDGVPVVALSYGLWVRGFGADPAVVGTTIRLDGRAVRIAAVMPPGFDYPARTQLWLARPIDAADVGTYWGQGGYKVIGRLRSGASPQQVESAIRQMSPMLSAANPLWTPKADYRSNVRVVPLRDAIVADVRSSLLLLGGAVGLLLMIACANVANLVLARGLSRARELAVRTALGANGGRIVRELLTETVGLALAGGVAGIVLAFASAAAVRRALPTDLPRATEVGIDLRVLAASLVLTLTTGLLLGVLPVRRARRFNLASTLREGGRGTGDRSTRRLSGTLVVSQVAFAVLLVTGATLLVRSLTALQHVDTGIGQMKAVAARVDLPSQYATAGERNAFYDALLARVSALPGVTTAALTSQLPFSSEFHGSAMAIEHVTTDPNDLPMLVHRRVTPEYFDALGVPLRSGRLFDENDMSSALPIAIVDEAAARAFWPGENPIGRRLGRPWLNEMLVVVGVVGSVLDGELTRSAEPAIYTPLGHEPTASAYLMLNGDAGLGALPGVRRALREIDRAVPFSDAATMQSRVDAHLTAHRFATTLLGVFGALALVLAAVGTYGVLAHAVGQRTREFALRLAVGARMHDVAAIVLREGGMLVGAGALLGTSAALVLGRFVSGMVYGASPTDAVTLLAVTCTVIGIAVAGALVPALRASRVDPMQALRD